MDKMEYLSILGDRLSSLPKKERDEAIRYYDDLFNDAGFMNEQAVIASLGSPKELAHTILNDKNGISYEFKKTRKSVSRAGRKISAEKKYSYAVITVVTFPIWGTLLILLFASIALIFAAAVLLLSATAISGVVLAAIGVAYINKLFSIFLTFVGTGVSLVSLSLILFNPTIKFTIYLIKLIVKNFMRLINKILGKTEAGYR